MELISGSLRYYSVKKCVQTDCLLFNCNWYLRYSIPVSERKNLASFYGHDVESAETSLADKMVSITLSPTEINLSLQNVFPHLSSCDRLLKELCHTISLLFQKLKLLLASIEFQK